MVTVKEVQELYKRLKRDYEEAKVRESEIDILQQNILHYIEIENYNAAQGSQLIKKLKEVRKARRVIKAQCNELQLLVCRLNNAKLDDIKISNSCGYALSLEAILNKEIPA